MRENKNYFEQVVASSADGILIIDTEGYIAEVNDSLATMVGYSPIELLGKHITKLLPVTLKDRDFIPQIMVLLKNKKTVITQHTWIKRDEQPLSVELHTTFFKRESGETMGVLSSVRDITEKVEIGEELRQRNRELLVLNTIISFLSQFINIGELLDNALARVLEIMKIETGALLLLNEKENVFTLEASEGFSPGFVSKIAQIDGEAHLIGRAVRAGESLLLGGEELSKLIDSEWVLSENINSCMCFPLKTKKRIYGMVIFAHRHSRFFSEHEVQLLKNIGYQITLSIENALLFKEVRDSEERYRLLTESANIGIISFTREGNIFQFNKKAEDIFRFSRDEVMNTSVLPLLPENHSLLIEKISRLYMSSGKHKAIDQPLVDYGRGKDSIPIPFEISYSIWGERINPLITATIRELS